MSAAPLRASARLFEEGGSLDREWEDLAHSTGAPPWAFPGWFRAWRGAFAPQQALTVVEARDGGRLAGVGAFLRRSRRLEAAANVHTPWWGLVGESPAARDALAAGALEAGSPAVRFLQVQEGADDGEALHRSARAHGCRVLDTVVERAPFVRVEGDWRSYLDGHLGRHQTKELRRRRRRLAERHTVEFEWLSPDRDEVDALVDEGLAVEGSGWKRRTGTAVLSSPATASFYRELARFAAASGWLRLGFLRVDGRPGAFELALEKDGVVSLLKGGYDEALTRFGPGILLLHDLLEHAFARRVSEVDLLGGSDPYKLRWADGARARALVAAYAGTPSGGAAYAAHRAALAARAAARRARAQRAPSRRP